jgi:predicted outer membrane protein
MSRYPFLSGVAAAAIAMSLLSGCGRTEATAPGQAHVSAYDLDFITNLYNVVEFDREVIGNELGRTPDPRVAALARDLLSEANKLAAEVKPIADREGIVQPTQVTFQRGSDLHTRIASVMATGTYDFDQEFLSDEIDSHEEALRRAREMSEQPAGDPQLKAISLRATALLTTNLARLNALQKQLKASAG